MRKPRKKLVPVVQDSFEQMLEGNLATSVTGGGSNDAEPDLPMILVYGHNRNIITNYKVHIEQFTPTEPTIDARDLLSDETSQRYLAKINGIKEQFKRNLWGKLIPSIVGFELAQSEIEDEMKELFGNIVVPMGPYSRALRDVVFAACVQEVSAMLKVSKTDAELILRSKLDEQIYRSRTDARASSTPSK